ncbi:MAG: ABC transporter substrate-binding protein [Eubacteriales bacterium]|nr:ABC transporter substrate-binding protein [Eubacteriales bacterium]
MKKKFWISVALLLAAVLSAACAAVPPAETPQPAVTAKVIFTDALGHEVSLPALQKAACCMGSFADVWQLAGGTVIGATQDAFEDGILESSDAITDLGSLKTPSSETLLALRPDVVFLSANLPGHVELYDVLQGAGISTAYFDVENFADYLTMLKTCTQVTGREDLFEKYGVQVQQRVDQAIERGQGKASPSVLLLRAYSGGVKAKGSDNMTGAMLSDLGCRNIADSEESLLEDLSMEKILQEDPDFIFVVTMGSSQDKALEALKEQLESNPAWNTLRAVREKRYVLLPKELFQNKPNARWGESYEILADTLYGK